METPPLYEEELGQQLLGVVVQLIFEARKNYEASIRTKHEHLRDINAKIESLQKQKSSLQAGKGSPRPQLTAPLKLKEVPLPLEQEEAEFLGFQNVQDCFKQCLLIFNFNIQTMNNHIKRREKVKAFTDASFV